MADVFGKNTKFADHNILTADTLLLNIAGKDTNVPGFLVQNITLQYNQPLNRIYEVGSEFVYFSPGRPIGSIQIGRIIGQQPFSKFISTGPKTIWSAKGVSKSNRTITLKKTPNSTGPNITIIITGAIVESYGFAADANGLLVQENVAIQFAGLSFPP